MSKQISIAGWITAEPAKSWQKGDANVIDGMAYQFWGFKPSGGEEVIVTAHTMTFDVPKGWDPRPEKIKALEAKKAELQRQFAASVAQINAQIASLQAIEYTPEAA